MRLMLATLAAAVLIATVVVPALQAAPQFSVTEWSAARKKTKANAHRVKAHKRQAGPERYLRGVPAR